MKTATVRQLRTTFPRIESWLQEGETIAITKHKKIVAELSAPRHAGKPNFAQRFSFSGRLPSIRTSRNVVALLLEERGT